MSWTLIVTLLVLGGLAAALALVAWGVRWGSTAAERAASMPGDAYFAGGPRAFVAMTRAVDFAAPPATVWPWLAQLGRGAGWYSHNRLDNGGRESAHHLVSWIPPPRLGDASAIGYLRHLVPGSELCWWAPGVPFLGAFARAAVDIGLRPEGAGSRVVIRMSGDATGRMARPALWAFRVIDSLMAVRQLRGLRRRVEHHGARTSDPERPETGARDQYQLYEVIWASGGRAGVPGREQAARWRQAALEAGVLAPERGPRHLQGSSSG